MSAHRHFLKLREVLKESCKLGSKLFKPLQINGNKTYWVEAYNSSFRYYSILRNFYFCGSLCCFKCKKYIIFHASKLEFEIRLCIPFIFRDYYSCMNIIPSGFSRPLYEMNKHLHLKKIKTVPKT